MMDGFFNDLGGFLARPGQHCTQFLAGSITKRVSLQIVLFIQLLGVMLGMVVMFMMFYPEIQMLPGSITGGLRLFVLPLGNPALLLSALALGYAIVFLVNFTCIGHFNYMMTRFFLKRMHPGTTIERKKFLLAHGIAQAPMGLFCAFNAFWIYFFEKVNYAKIFFPFVDFAEPVIVYFSVLTAFLSWKWVIQARVMQASGLDAARSVFIVTLEIVFLVSCITFIAVAGNMLVPQFS